jgi:hypothetical protein
MARLEEMAGGVPPTMPADPGGFDLGRIPTTLDPHRVEYLLVGGLSS